MTSQKPASLRRLDPAAIGPVKVMVVDDSAIARGFVRRWVETEDGMEIVASLQTAREALNYLERTDPDVVVLDIEMPDMDGITALPLILQKRPDVAVIIASTLTRRNAEISLRALSLGALDCIQKPDAQGAVTSESYRHALVTRIRELGARARRVPAITKIPSVEPATPKGKSGANILAFVNTREPISLRPMPTTAPRVLVVGSSTGGPQALTEICTRLGPVIDQAPVLITQHMPPTFTSILAEHLARATGRPAQEAEDGEPICAGHIYIAPGHRHFRVARTNGQPVAILDDAPPVHFCKPAVDILFSSAAEVWGAWVLGLVLTGMGTDGTGGAADIVASGGSIIAQDEATSIVWGMPGSVAQAGLCSSILPLNEIAPAITHIFTGRRA
ncbi:two-component system chemotaxis response regulator CheB [Pseudorhodoplanes sinuspersici]|nr:two-component system chemotaxis response regulator CheB [Pseudorhodoplanes sinuspersici]